MKLLPKEMSRAKTFLMMIIIMLMTLAFIPSPALLLAADNEDENSDTANPAPAPPAPFSQIMLHSLQESALPAEAYYSYTARFQIGKEEYYIDDTAYTMDVKPYTSKGRSFIPVRFLAYACGLTDDEVSWSANTRTVTLTGSPGVLRMRLESSLVYYNEDVELMDVCPESRTGRIFLPARYVAEFFGFTVEWEAGTRTVTIRS